MSNTVPSPKRIARWFLVCGGVTAVLFALAGQWRDPWLWAYVSVFAVIALFPTFLLDDDLARERFHPPEPGADRVPLKAIRLIALAHLVLGALDAGRWHLGHMPSEARLVGLVGMAISMALVFRAMMANRFFSTVVRIQRDRGHHVVDQDVYAVVRHPGYAGMIPLMTFSGLALGSWLALAIGLVYSALVLRRVLFEDAFLRVHLEGYADYAARVRYRLIPGVW
jgi:protein-S-isoprenylcysteine O-methyltransferase Ste14